MEREITNRKRFQFTCERCFAAFDYDTVEELLRKIREHDEAEHPLDCYPEMLNLTNYDRRLLRGMKISADA